MKRKLSSTKFEWSEWLNSRPSSPKVLFSYFSYPNVEIDKFGTVVDINGQTWKQEVNQAGDDIWVIVHLYDKGVMLSNILNNHFVNLAQKYKHVKFVRGVAKVRHISHL